MKKLLTFLNLTLILGLFHSYPAAGQQTSLWLRNISEGMGSMVTDLPDYNPDVAASGSMVHTIWITYNGGNYELYYRRSADYGENWDAKIQLAAGLVDQDFRYNRLAVSGNYVHIVANRTNGSFRELVYFRSTDGGATFEPLQVLYNTDVGYIYNPHISVQNNKVAISMTHECHYCAVKKWLYLIKSEDNGSTFETKLVLEDVYGTYSSFDALKMEGEHVYLLYEESIGYWANYDFELHLLYSNDGGNTFNNQIISEPAASGISHAFPLLDYNNGYAPKIAADGDNVWIVWSGWDDTNTPSVFVRHSADGGETLSPLNRVSESVTYLHSGLETIAAGNNQVYVVFNTGDNRLFVNQSEDGGMTYKGLEEFTVPNARHIDYGLEPQLVFPPSGYGAFLVSNGPKIGKLLPGDERNEQVYYGNYSHTNSRRPKLAISDNGILHVVVESGGEWMQTGVFSDLDIWYRQIDLTYYDPGITDQVLNMRVDQNVGDGTGNCRFDNMIISPDLGKQFTDAMTIEMWLKPEAINLDQKIISQLHKNTWNIWDPLAFQLAMNQFRTPISGLVTETGSYTIAGDKKLEAGYWNHLAIVYHNDGSADNFRMYLNGQEIASTTVTGSLQPLNALWVVGSVAGGFGAYFTDGFTGQIDELRFWNVARTQEEIRENRFGVLETPVPGLVAYYTFNLANSFGEVTDMTGNGYTGHFTYQEELLPSSIKDIGVKFRYTQTVSTFSFFQESEGAESFLWDFGNGIQSDQVNPTITYATPGIYQVCLTAYGTDVYDTYCQEVQVEGIEKIYPTEAGNTDYVTLYIYGGGFNASNVVKLRRSGYPDIVAEMTIFDEAKTLTALLDLALRETGKWDLVIANGAQELVLPEAFTIVPGEKAEPTVTYNGGGLILINRWTPQTITIGNKSNVDAHGVLLWVTLPEATGNDLAFINLNMTVPEQAVENGWESELKSMGEYFVVDSLFGRPNHSRVYALYFPILPARSNFDISMRVKLGSASNQVPVNVWLSGPFYHSPLSPEVQGCVALSTAKAFIKAGVSFIPGVACITGAMAVFSDYVNDQPPTPSAFKHLDTRNWGWILGSNLLECAASLYGGSMITGMLTIITSSVENAQENADCYSGFRQIGWLDILYYPVWSFDPNEKAGTPGVGPEGYIGQQSRLGYQVRFENKSDATAPAQEVVILDTLTFDKVDLSTFSFGPFGWGDSLFIPLPNSREFSMDIDLRPAKDVVVRVTGTLDEANKVVKWQFLSLDPVTLDLVTDPLGGFLPPNQTAPEGEGFVNFTIGISNNILNNDRIENRANILFDANEPIVTNLHLNTFDLQAPESSLSIQGNTTTDTLIQVEVNSSDAESQVRQVEIWVSEDGGDYVFSHSVQGPETKFTGRYGSTYRLYSIAVDKVGNREAIPSIADAEITVLTATNEVTGFNSLRAYPSPTKEWLTLEFELDKTAPVTVDLEELTGQSLGRLFSGVLQPGFNRIPMRLTVGSGIYLLRISNGIHSVSEKVVVVK